MVYLSIQFSSVAQSCPTLCNPMDCSTPGFPGITNFWSLLKLMSIGQWCHPTISSSVVPFSSCLQSFPASRSFLMSQLFASGSQKYWHFSFSISPSNEYSELISFRIDWFDLLTVQSLSIYHTLCPGDGDMWVSISHPHSTADFPCFIVLHFIVLCRYWFYLQFCKLKICNNWVVTWWLAFFINKVLFLN